MGYRIIRPASHEDWLEERKKGIGSSEAGTIMGVNKFDTPYKLWRRKTGVDGPVEMNDAMRLGHQLEPSVAEAFAEATGAVIKKASAGDWLAVDSRRDFLRVSPDRIYFLPGEAHTRKNQRILECKTTSVAVDKDDIPSYWYCQIQYQMGIMGVSKGALAWISSSPRLNFDYLEVDFNRAFYEQLISAITTFWEVNICQGIAPEDISASDTILRNPEAVSGEQQEADESVMQTYYDLKEVNQKLKILDDLKADLEDSLKMAIGRAESLVSMSGTVIAQWKNTRESRRFNPKAFQAADPQGYEKYVETIPGGRRFTIK